jgi:hypothetical protein
MHKINQDVNLKLYSADIFSQRALKLSANAIANRLIPSLIASSEKFVLQRALAAKTRAMKYYKEYGLNTANQVSLAETLTEVMFDRPILKRS